jgi:hypothetical protein
MNEMKNFGSMAVADLRRAFEEYLKGNSELSFAIPRSRIEAWADGIELPFAHVSRDSAGSDGIYVLHDPEGWLVLQKVAGTALPGARIYASYREAKRAALIMALPAILGIDGETPA